MATEISRNITPETRLLKVKEVSEILGVSLATVYAWIYDGKLPCFKFEGTRRIHPAVLSDFVAGKGEG